MNKNYYILKVIILISIVVIISCNNSNDFIVIDNNSYDLSFVDGSYISSLKYNELSPIIVQQKEGDFLYYVTDNKELKGYKGGFDIYVCKWNSELESFNFPELLYITCPKKDDEINTKENERYYSVILTSNNETMFFFNREYSDGTIKLFCVYNGKLNELEESGIIQTAIPHPQGAVLVLKKGNETYMKLGYIMNKSVYINEYITKNYDSLKTLDFNSISYIDNKYIGSESCGFIYSKYTDSRNNELFLQTSSGTSVVLSDFSTSGNDTSAFIAPNGKLYFSSDIDGSYDLFVWNRKQININYLKNSTYSYCSEGRYGE